MQNNFSLLRGVNSFWHYCIMVGVLLYILWLEDDMLIRLFLIWIFPPQPLILKVAKCWKVHWLVVRKQVLVILFGIFWLGSFWITREKSCTFHLAISITPKKLAKCNNHEKYQNLWKCHMKIHWIGECCHVCYCVGDRKMIALISLRATWKINNIVDFCQLSFFDHCTVLKWAVSRKKVPNGLSRCHTIHAHPSFGMKPIFFGLGGGEIFFLLKVSVIQKEVCTLKKKSWNEVCFVHTLRFLCFVHRIEVENVPIFNVAHFYLVSG